MTEFGVMASECPRRQLHVDSSMLAMEVIDDQGNLRPPGQAGELVATGIRNRAMPLLRYRTGDVGALEYDGCACGSREPRLVALAARQITCFRLPSGALFSPTHFNDLYARFPELEEFQITQLAADRYELRVQFRDGADHPARLDPLGAYVSGAIPGTPRVTVAPTVFTRDCKFQRYRTCL
jgi:phenylacetate-coenzyme A ligase PaaK-like adenylate-forming protein